MADNSSPEPTEPPINGTSISPEARERSRSIEIQSVQFSGPLPPPEILAQYDQVNPGTSAILIEMLRSQSQHRQKIEEIVIVGNVSAQRRGQHYGLVVAIFAFMAAILFGYMGFPNVSGIIVGSTLIALVGLFVTSKYMQSVERARNDLAQKGKR